HRRADRRAPMARGCGAGVGGGDRAGTGVIFRRVHCSFEAPAMNSVRTIDTALIGLGNVNRNFLRILEMKGVELVRRYGLAFRVVCVADSSGVAVNPTGFDPAATRTHKEAGRHV